MVLEIIFFSFFYEWGMQDGHNVPFLKSVSLKKRKREAVTRIKQIATIFKIGESNISEEKKKSCHLVPKVVIDLPFEGRKVEGSRKYRRWERVPQAGRRECASSLAQ